MRKGDDLITFTLPKVEKIRSLNLPYPQGPVQACSGKTLPSIHRHILCATLHNFFAKSDVNRPNIFQNFIRLTTIHVNFKTLEYFSTQSCNHLRCIANAKLMILCMAKR